MRHSGLIVLAILLTVLTTRPATAAPPRTLPPPRWQLSVGATFDEHPQNTRISTAGNAIIISPRGCVVAVDRRNGRELWRRTNSVVSQRDTSSAAPDRGSPAVEPPAGGVTEQRIETDWTLVTCGDVDAVGPVAVLWEDRQLTVPDRTRANGERTSHTVTEIALKAMSGQTLWRSPATDSYYATLILGGLLIDSKDVDAEPGQVIALRYREAATGAALDAGTPQRRAEAELAAQHQGESPVIFPTFNALYSANIESGMATCLYKSMNYMVSWARYPAKGRIVIYNDLVDGFAGHSDWPKIVECTDLHGATLWMFPKKLHYYGVDVMETIPEPYSIDPMAPCRARGTLLCVSDRVRRNGRYWWYGLDVRDARILWKNQIVGEPPLAVEGGGGFLVAGNFGSAAAGKTTVAWMDGRSGKLSWIARAPGVANMFVSGHDLLLLDTAGKLADYPLDTILPTVARKWMQ